VDFAQACELALTSWQVLPTILPRLLDWAGSGLVDDPVAQRVRDRAVGLTIVSRIQLTLCRRLVEAFAGQGVPYVLLKSSAVRLTSYPSPELRSGKDIDVGVPAPFLRQAERIACELGFVPAEWDRRTNSFRRADPVLRALVESRHHELGFLARRQRVSGLTPEQEAAIRRDLPNQYIWHLAPDGRLACYTYVDIHHGLNLDMRVEPLVETAQVWEGDGWSAKVPRAEWTLLHLIYKIYWEGVHNYRKGGYQFADLARLLPQVSEESFQILLRLLARYNLDAAAYYVLRRLESDLGMELTPDQRAFLERAGTAPARGEPVDLNDLGDMWPKLWGYR
jgi:hypothetical protein